MDDDVVSDFVAALHDQVLFNLTFGKQNAIQMQLADVMLSELEKVSATAGANMKEEHVILLLRPFFRLYSESEDQAVRRAIENSILDPLAEYKREFEEKLEAKKLSQVKSQLRELDTVARSKKNALPLSFKLLSHEILQFAKQNENKKYRKQLYDWYQKFLVGGGEEVASENLLESLEQELVGVKSQEMPRKRSREEMEDDEEEQDEDFVPNADDDEDDDLDISALSNMDDEEEAPVKTPKAKKQKTSHPTQETKTPKNNGKRNNNNKQTPQSSAQKRVSFSSNNMTQLYDDAEEVSKIHHSPRVAGMLPSSDSIPTLPPTPPAFRVSAKSRAALVRKMLKQRVKELTF